MVTTISDHPQPGLPAGTPLLLLPIRVETRFMPGAQTPELWLRVYPDQLAVDAHQPGLTQAEIDAGTAYWDAVWRAGVPPADLEAVKGPWRSLARSFSPQRAAWIARQLTPQNAVQQPQAPVPAGTAPQPAPQYPPLPPRTTKDERPPLAAALPDRWTVVTYSLSGVRMHTSAPVRAPLPVGLTPGGAPFPADLPVDEGMRWLVDFAEAERTGMALRIPLTGVEAEVGLDRVLVYGLRTGGFKAPGEDDLAALLDADHYTDGLAFVPQGQPTNNTPDASSAFSRVDPDYETSFTVERQDALTGGSQDRRAGERPPARPARHGLRPRPVCRRAGPGGRAPGGGGVVASDARLLPAPGAGRCVHPRPDRGGATVVLRQRARPRPPGSLPSRQRPLRRATRDQPAAVGPAPTRRRSRVGGGAGRRRGG